MVLLSDRADMHYQIMPDGPGDQQCQLDGSSKGQKCNFKNTFSLGFVNIIYFFQENAFLKV